MTMEIAVQMARITPGILLVDAACDEAAPPFAPLNKSASRSAMVSRWVVDRRGLPGVTGSSCALTSVVSRSGACDPKSRVELDLAAEEELLVFGSC